MMNDTEHEQPNSTICEAKKNSFIENAFNGPVAYKVVLSSVVIGIISVFVVWLSMAPQKGNSNIKSLVLPTDIRTDEVQKTNSLKASREEHELFNQLLESISSRIDGRALVQAENSALAKSEFQDLTESIKQIDEMMSELGESQKALIRQFSESISGLKSIAEDVHALKTSKQKTTTRKKPRLVKKPPFVIDAIDVWDDVGYVAVSQAGQVSFLKVGDQQSGWTLTDIDHIKGQVSFQSAGGNVFSTAVQR
jgi:hypothetical protein